MQYLALIQKQYVIVNRATCMYVFGYLGADIRIILKWLLQHPL